MAYINSDGNGRGYLGMDGSHSLTHFINGVARDIQDPETKISAYERRRFREIENAKSEDDRKELHERADLHLAR